MKDVKKQPKSICFASYFQSTRFPRGARLIRLAESIHAALTRKENLVFARECECDKKKRNLYRPGAPINDQSRTQRSRSRHFTNPIPSIHKGNSIGLPATFPPRWAAGSDKKKEE